MSPSIRLGFLLLGEGIINPNISKWKGTSGMAEALYRKYRPQVFSDVVGQDHIVRTLQNAVEQGKVSHAYLFCGPRGTGKTTMARLLSKAMLCSQGPTPDPDGTCEDCRLIAAGSHPDVYELDAASRTGVENVREEIIGRVQFAPTRGASKIYIIDEVHMLSTAAFNALLKTLEEPPSHVVFVLCTTDPQKVPETIHSRCQRFDFRRIGQEAMVAKLGAVCVAEGVSFDGEALELVAHRADGGMRNALTTLEQLIAFSGGNVSIAAAEDMLGGLDSSDVAELVAAVGKRDAGGCFAWIARYVETGGDLAQFARDLAEHIRDLYVMSLVGTDAPLDVSDAMRTQMADELQWFGSDRLARALCVLGDLMSELKTSTNARLSFEIAAIRLTRPETDLTLESLAERVEDLERNGVATKVENLERNSVATKVVTAPASELQNQAQASESQRCVQAQTTEPQRHVQTQAPERQTNTQAPEPQNQVPTEAKAAAVPPQQATPEQSLAGGTTGAGDAWAKAAQNPASLQRLWQQVMAALKKDKGPYAVLFMNTRVSYDEQRGVLCVEFPKEATFAFKAVQKPEVSESLTAAVVATLGVPAPFCYVQIGGAKVSTQVAQNEAVPQQTQAANPPRPAPVQQQQQQIQQPQQQQQVGQQQQQVGQQQVQQQAQQQVGQQPQRPQQPQQQQTQQPQPQQQQAQPQPRQQAIPQRDQSPQRREQPNREQSNREQPNREQPKSEKEHPRASQGNVDDGYDEVPLDVYDGFVAPWDDSCEDPAADALWQGNLEDAFGPLEVQRL